MTRENPKPAVSQRWKAHLVLGDVNRFVEDDPRDCLVTAGLRERAFIRHVVRGAGEEAPDGQA